MTTRYVSNAPSGQNSYSTLQAALDASSIGDTVSVDVGYTGEKTGTVNVERLTVSAPASVTGLQLTLNTANGIALAGDADIQVTGNANANAITGNLGADTLIGGAGDDTYTVASAATVITEANGAGTDKVMTGLATYTLPDNVEILQGTAATGQSLIGNYLDNTIFGGAGNDTIDGGSGKDLVYGGVGDDIIMNSSGEDTLVGGPGRDTLTGSFYTQLDGVTGETTPEPDLLIVTGSGLYSTVVTANAGDTVRGSAGQDIVSTDVNSFPTLIDGAEQRSGNDASYGDVVVLNGRTNGTFRPVAGSIVNVEVLSLDNTGGRNRYDFSALTKGERFGEFLGSDDGSAGYPVDIIGTSGDDTIGVVYGSTVTGGAGNDLVRGGFTDFTNLVDTDIDTGEKLDIFDATAGFHAKLSDSGKMLTIYKGSSESNFITVMLADGTPGASISTAYQSSGGSSGDGIITFTAGPPVQPAPTPAPTGGGSSLTISTVPSSGPDSLAGTTGADTIVAQGGDDTIAGNGGDDLVLGQQGDDVITVGDGRNTVYGGMDQDRITAGDGDNLIYGGEGSDTIQAGNGNNTIVGGTGDGSKDSLDGADVIRSGAGNDLILGNGGDDTIAAGGGADSVSGGYGNDVILGNQGSDVVLGNQGDDTLFGGFGNDTLVGGQGNDVLYGNEGDDALYGNEGLNTFVFAPGDTDFRSQIGTGDTVMDFATGTSRIDFASGPVGTVDDFASAQSASTDFASIQALAQTLLNGTVSYAFVADGVDGFLFTNGGNGTSNATDAVKLAGVGTAGAFKYQDIAHGALA